MYEWNEAVQEMVDWLEAHLLEEPTLPELSRQVGYSPTYCSMLFHRVCGVTLKSYTARRRLTLAAQALRNSQERILDIALACGFSSQEALTRAFRSAFGLTPAAFRRGGGPLPLFLPKEVFSPWHRGQQQQGGNHMSLKDLREARVRVEYIPAHKYVGVWEERARNYGEFWRYHDCDAVCGTVESLRSLSHPVVASHTAGWWYPQGERRYFYGFGALPDYAGPVPEGFAVREFPGSYYLVFYHPPFDYMEDNGEVMRRVEELAWNYDLAKARLDASGLSTAAGNGRFVWNEEACQCYQRHYPEGLGYEILRPVALE